jgi:hypothetical protein
MIVLRILVTSLCIRSRRTFELYHPSRVTSRRTQGRTFVLVMFGKPIVLVTSIVIDPSRRRGALWDCDWMELPFQESLNKSWDPCGVDCGAPRRLPHRHAVRQKLLRPRRARHAAAFAAGLAGAGGLEGRHQLVLAGVAGWSSARLAPRDRAKLRTAMIARPIARGEKRKASRLW